MTTAALVMHDAFSLIPDAFGLHAINDVQEYESKRSFSPMQVLFPGIFVVALTIWFWSGIGYSGLMLSEFDDHVGASVATIVALACWVALIVAFVVRASRSNSAWAATECCSVFQLMIMSTVFLAISTVIIVETA